MIVVYRDPDRFATFQGVRTIVPGASFSSSDCVGCDLYVLFGTESRVTLSSYCLKTFDFFIVSGSGSSIVAVSGCEILRGVESSTLGRREETKPSIAATTDTALVDD